MSYGRWPYTSNAAEKAFLDMLGVFADFETNLCREQQMDGVAAAMQRGVYNGRKPRIDPMEALRLSEVAKFSPTTIARRLGIARSSTYRFLPGAKTASE